jgi:hypothetical protein
VIFGRALDEFGLACRVQAGKQRAFLGAEMGIESHRKIARTDSIRAPVAAASPACSMRWVSTSAA